MNTFLHKHDIDVGKTFGILILLAMVYQIYDLIFYGLFFGKLKLNLGIIVSYFLGLGMYRHKNTARRWTLFSLWLTLALFVGLAIASPFVSGEVVSIGQEKVKNPPFWKTVLFLLPRFHYSGLL